jgi:uncharacterized SAM-binding protein YcdF (DUF218 family)
MRLLGAATAAAGCLAAFTPLPNAAARRFVTQDPIAPADAVVPLAGSIAGDGHLGDSSLRRLVRAIELHADGAAPLLVLTGTVQGRGLDEAAVRLALARRLGVADAAIVAQGGQRSTREEAVTVTAILRSRGGRRVLLVTDWFHAGRARAAFRAAGLDARVAVTSDAAEAARTPGERLELSWLVARELAAKLYYRLAGYL